MENRWFAVAADNDSSGAHPVLQIGEHWRLAREAHKDLQTMGMPRTNLLLVGTPDAVAARWRSAGLAADLRT